MEIERGRHNIGSTVYIHAAGVGNQEEIGDTLIWFYWLLFFLLVFHHRYRTCKSQGRKSPWRKTNKSNKFHVWRRRGGGVFASLHFTEFFFFQIKFQGKRTRQSPDTRHFFFFAINTKKVGKVWDGWRRTKEKQHVSRWTDTIYHIHWPLIRHITRCPTLLFWLQFLTGVRQNNRRLDCFLFPPEPPSRHPRATSHNEMFHPRQKNKNKNKNKIMKHFCFESLFPRFCCGCCYFRTHRHTCRTIRLLLV